LFRPPHPLALLYDKGCSCLRGLHLVRRAKIPPPTKNDSRPQGREKIKAALSYK
jgi:hypothetical protein